MTTEPLDPPCLRFEKVMGAPQPGQPAFHTMLYCPTQSMYPFDEGGGMAARENALIFSRLILCLEEPGKIEVSG